MACPDELELLDFSTGALVGSLRAAVETHVDVCTACFDVVAALAADELAHPRTKMAGRYRLGVVIGEGAMGTVYEAHDPLLDRVVAVKVLRGDLPATEQRRVRLLREAQSLARIRHPNVVAIHDAGETAGSVYLAMELVQGVSLEQHLRRRAFGWRELVALFVPTGRGLAATHAGGIVHRDFKPSNVLVADDGRVLVTDFGLAALASDMEVDDHAGVAAPGLLAHALSATRARLGTPAYMAPEQLEGGRATPRSDQFAFCVALFEALCGRRPFDGTTPAAWLASQSAWPRAELLARVPGPARLAGVLRRGLEFAPERRFPSMDALLDALGRCASQRRRRVAAFAAGAAGVLVVASTWMAARPPASCADPLAQVWDDARREPVRARLLAPDSGAPISVARTGLARLDGYGDALGTAFAELCIEMPRAIEAASPTQRGRWACLLSRRAGLDALGRAVIDAPADGVAPVLGAIDSLQPVSDCASPELALRREPQPESPELRERLGELRVALELTRVRLEAEQPGAGDDLDRLTEAGVSLGYPPFDAELRHRRAWVLLRAGDLEGAVAAFRAAHGIAVASDHEGIAAASARGIVLTLWQLGRFGEARGWSDAAAPIHRTLPERIELAVARAMVAGAELRFDEAQQHFDEAYALREACGACEGAGAKLDATLAIQHGDLLLAIDDLPAAAAAYQRGLQLIRERLGADHIAVADVLVGLADVARQLGELDEARTWLAEAFAIADAQDSTLPTAWANLAEIQHAEGDHHGAIASYRRARAEGPSGVFAAVMAVGEARSLAGVGHPLEAAALCSTAIAALGEHPRAIESVAICRAVEDGHRAAVE